ncbi:unnamed protein product, partial [Prorocentrum cordatum]
MAAEGLVWVASHAYPSLRLWDGERRHLCLLPRMPWLAQRFAEEGVDAAMLDKGRRVSAQAFTLRGLARVAPGVVQRGPLTQWSEQEQVWDSYFRGPTDSHSVRVTDVWAVLEGCCRTTVGVFRLRPEPWNALGAVQRHVPA